MGFSDAKNALIRALLAVQREEISLFHDAREPGDADKNLLEQGDVTPDDVIEMAKAAQGGHLGANYETSKHHDRRKWKGVDVHVLKNIRWQGEDWYVKWFFSEPDLWFISVHRSTTTTR